MNAHLNLNLNSTKGMWTIFSYFFKQLEKFREYLNSKHANISFTSEIEIEGRLPFLDMLVDRNGGITTSVYRKPTFTGIYTHANSFLPSIYKFGLLSTILFRYFSLCSTFSLFHKEIVEFKSIFLKNGYSLKIIDNCLQKFLSKIFAKKVLKDTAPRRDYRIVLPYLGPLSDKIQKRLKSVFKRYIPVGNIKIIWKTKRRLSHFLKFKDVVTSDYESHIIYKFSCPSCNAGYVGETRTHFIVRSSQHLAISEFTGKPTTAGVPTNITKHLREKQCNCTRKSFSIIGKETDYHKRLIKESLYIKLYNPSLNEQETSIKLYLFD